VLALKKKLSLGWGVELVACPLVLLSAWLLGARFDLQVIFGDVLDS
jgi:hypothetical protein